MDQGVLIAAIVVLLNGMGVYPYKGKDAEIAGQIIQAAMKEGKEEAKQ